MSTEFVNPKPQSVILPPRQRPIIHVTNKQLRESSNEAWNALQGANVPPRLFTRAGELVRIRGDERGRSVVEPASEAILRHLLTNAADFFRPAMNGPVSVNPPAYLAKDILSFGEWDVPPLTGIIEVPVMRGDGSILDTPGYDPGSGLYYAPSPDLSISSLLVPPTRADVARAVELLNEVFGDFPFADKASRANLIGTLLTPFIRPNLGGTSPLALFDAPQQGTGKSLLTNVVSLIATGHYAAMMTAPNSEDEWRKRITAILYSGSSVILIDNLEGRLTSSSLASAITSLTWRDRYLGASRMLEIPQRATWIGNGNNIRLGGDLQRRCYWIKLDANSGQPWLGRKFRHPDLLGYVTVNRGALVNALLTLAKAWHLAGQPKGCSESLGGFEKWCTVIDGILTFAGVEGFLSNLQEMYEVADEETAEWEAFLLALQSLYSGAPFTVASVVEHLEAGRLADELPETLEVLYIGRQGSFAKKLGKAISSREGRRFGPSEAHFERAGICRDGQLWKVISN